VLGTNLKGATTAIQGYGNAGSFAHKLGTELLGLKVVAVSDSRGGIYNTKGLDYEAVMAHKAKTGSVVKFPGAEPISNEALLELDVTVLIPSALESVLTAQNASKVKAKISVELANGPTTPEADRILYDAGCYVIPDFLCNAGGVTVSYFEMVQNAYDYYWQEELVHERLDAKMTAAFHAVHAAAQEHQVHNRLAAYLDAVSRVAGIRAIFATCILISFRVTLGRFLSGLIKPRATNDAPISSIRSMALSGSLRSRRYLFESSTAPRIASGVYWTPWKFS
jgi:glutamate dehydrogenase (NAD(P)+)